MQCRKFKKWLMKDPEKLTSNEMERLKEHLSSCDECRLIREKLPHLPVVFSRMGKEPVPDEIKRELWPGIRSRLRAPVAPVKARRAPVLRLAGSFAAVTVIVLLFWTFLTDGEKPYPAGSGPRLAQLDVVIESAQIDGKNAAVSVFQTSDPDITFIWLE